MADYAITNVSRRVVYTGSAGVGPYAFSFPVLTNTDIAVYKNTTLLALTTDYTVTISSTTGQGSITLVTAATGSDTITIVGARAIQRSTDFVTGGDFFANTLNTELDSEVIFVQQVAETAERSLKAPVTDPTSINMTLPVKATRANKFLAFDANGNPSTQQSIGVWKGNWAASTAYVVYDLIKDTSNNNVYICVTAHTSSGAQPISSNTDSAKWALVVDAAAAATSATNAASSASAAATSATNAASSASSASTSASAASTSATNAASSASSASTSASSASSSASSASTSASAASTSATNSANSATTAGTSETNAANSASAAATSATNAASSASAANTSASNASASATTATNKAADASTYASNALASANDAAATYDAFDDRYLGAKSSGPTVDNDGNTLITGALYWNTSVNSLYIWTGSAWDQAAFDISGSGVVSFNTRTGAVTLSSGDVTGALGYTPVTNARTLTINGTTYDLSANRTWTITAAINSGDVTTALGYTPLAPSDIGSQVQAYDADLGAIAALVGTSGFLKKTGTNTWTLDTSTYITNSAIGSTIQAWDADLDTWAGKTAPTGTVVGTTDSQTLTNKTLTTPVISSIVNTGTLTLPTSTDTLVGRATTDTLTNKTLTSPVISTIVNTGTLTLPTSTDTLVGRATTDTLTNKRITSRVGSTTSSATPTINTDNVDMYGLTAQAVDITSFTTNLTGTPTNGQKLWIYIVGTAARAITWGASFEASTIALPTTTVSTNRLDVGFVWNATTSKWRCVAVA